MATRDDLLPYDKTRLSKVRERKEHNINQPEEKDVFFHHFSTWICPESYLQVMNVETESILLRRMEFFLQYDIEVWLRKEVSLFLLICIITINCLYDVRFSNRFCFLDLCFRVCRRCQWTQMRKLSHLMMVQSRVMISCSSPRDAGTDFWDLDSIFPSRVNNYLFNPDFNPCFICQKLYLSGLWENNHYGPAPSQGLLMNGWASKTFI